MRAIFLGERAGRRGRVCGEMGGLRLGGVSRFNDRVGTRMSPAPRQSVRPTSSTSTQTAVSRRVPRDHSGTPRAIGTPMPTVLSRPSKWIGSCLRPPISSAASALSHSMMSSLFVFKQRCRQAAEFSVVLDD
jgi:hypothetical protein